jgi:hypothetical protein
MEGSKTGDSRKIDRCESEQANIMADRPKSGLRNVIIVWVIGLTLGIGAGAATALLLMPSASENSLPPGSSLADRLRPGKSQ